MSTRSISANVVSPHNPSSRSPDPFCALVNQDFGNESPPAEEEEAAVDAAAKEGMVS